MLPIIVLCCALSTPALTASRRSSGKIFTSTAAPSAFYTESIFPSSATVTSPGASARPRLASRARAYGIVATSTAPSHFPPSTTLTDGRTFRVFDTERDVSDYLALRVEELMVESIDAKGAVSLSIGSGTTVTPLHRLAVSARVDFGRVRLILVSLSSLNRSNVNTPQH